MKRAYIITPHGYTPVEVLDHRGDWAVTLHHGLLAITHLPTGARVAVHSDERRLRFLRALPDLAQLPPFDMQSFPERAADVTAVLAKHSLWEPRAAGVLHEVGAPTRKARRRSEVVS